MHDFINNLFGYYDKLVAPLPLSYQALVSVALIIFLVWNIWAFLKQGNVLLIIIFVAALPGTLPALKKIAEIIILLFKNLLIRA